MDEIKITRALHITYTATTAAAADVAAVLALDTAYTTLDSWVASQVTQNCCTDGSQCGEASVCNTPSLRLLYKCLSFLHSLHLPAASRAVLLACPVSMHITAKSELYPLMGLLLLCFAFCFCVIGFSPQFSIVSECASGQNRFQLHAVCLVYIITYIEYFCLPQRVDSQSKLLLQPIIM